MKPSSGCAALVVIVLWSAGLVAQEPAPSTSPAQTAPEPVTPAPVTPPPVTPPAVTPPPVTRVTPAPTAPVIAGAVRPPSDYIIGTDDVLSVVFWREKDMSTDTVVRPDGKITLPLLNDIVAAGLTTDQLRQRVETEAVKFIEEPSVTIVVKQINSRKVFITGEVNKPGPYNLTAPTTVLQLIAMAGGVREFAKRERILIMRTQDDKQSALSFNYALVMRGEKLQQNVFLKPGDVVIVP